MECMCLWGTAKLLKIWNLTLLPPFPIRADFHTVLTFILQRSAKNQLHKDILKSRNVAQSNVQIVNYIKLSCFAQFRRNVTIAVFPLKNLNIPQCLCKIAIQLGVWERKLISINSVEELPCQRNYLACFTLQALEILKLGKITFGRSLKAALYPKQLFPKITGKPIL